MRASKSLFFMKKQRKLIVKFQKFFEIKFKLQKFFEVLMLLLLSFHPNFSYLSDLTTTTTIREFQKFFYFYPQPLWITFRRCFYAAWR